MQSKWPTEDPLLCNLAVMTPAQRAHYEAQKKRLRVAIKETKALPDGYAFHFASEPNLLVAMAEFVEGERQCCAFYTFTLEVAPNNGGMWLRITGPKDTKVFIKDALIDMRTKERVNEEPAAVCGGNAGLGGVGSV